MFKKLVTLLFLTAFLCTNNTALAVAKESKENAGSVLKGNITKEDSKEYQVVVFIPKSQNPKQKLKDLESIGLGNIDLKRMKEVKYSDVPKIMDSKERLKKSAAFMLIGGMSVAGNVQRSIGDGQAEGKLADNLNPVRNLKDGWKADDNLWIVNYVGHPFEFFMLGSSLKASGATDKEAIIISQVINVLWETVIEGCYVPPSPKDLATDTIGSLAGIYFYNKVLNKPMDATYKKFQTIGEKYNVALDPQVKYNYDTRGLVIGTTLKIKR